MYTALHLACRQGNVTIVEQLLSCVGIGSHIKNKKGKTALESSENDKVRQVFQAVCPATTSSTTQAVTSPETAQQQRQSHLSPPSAPNKTSPSSPTPPKPHPPPTTARRITTMGTSKVLPRALDEGGDTINNNIRKQERDCWEFKARQLKNEITELKARITQLEEENTK
ncbi:hypothetical protein Pelo_19132, partial [Pelomyxa schiedti]